MARHRYETTLTFDPTRFDYPEADVGVSYTVSRLGEVEDIRLETVGGRKAPWGLHFHSDRHFAAIVAEVLEASELHAEAMVELALVSGRSRAA